MQIRQSRMHDLQAPQSLLFTNVWSLAESNFITHIQKPATRTYARRITATYRVSHLYRIHKCAFLEHPNQCIVIIILHIEYNQRWRLFQSCWNIIDYRHLRFNKIYENLSQLFREGWFYMRTYLNTWQWLHEEYIYLCSHVFLTVDNNLSYRSVSRINQGTPRTKSHDSISLWVCFFCHDLHRIFTGCARLQQKSQSTLGAVTWKYAVYE